MSYSSLVQCVQLVLAGLFQYTCSLEITDFYDRSIPEVETHLSVQDFQRARYVTSTADVVNNSPKNHSENPHLFEGDIFLGNLTLEAYTGRNVAALAESNHRVLFNAVRSRFDTWAFGRIPYAISSQYSSYARSRIAAAMQEYAEQTCVQFVPRSEETDYIYITPDAGCYSLVGRVGGKQTVSLDIGCISKGIVMHELMHSVGFFHEQSRFDRDAYVDIFWENILPGMEGQFRKFTVYEIQHLGTPYDYGSIMHYSDSAFSRNGQPTIVAKTKAEIGQRRAFSSIDKLKIDRLYNCDEAGLQTVQSTSLATTARTTAPGPTAKSVAVTTAPEVVVKPQFMCQDTRSDCSYLATLGYCKQYIDWMKEKCPGSCSLCDNNNNLPKKPGECKDENEFCVLWASANYCSNPVFTGYLHSRCRLSCKKC